MHCIPPSEFLKLSPLDTQILASFPLRKMETPKWLRSLFYLSGIVWMLKLLLPHAFGHESVSTSTAQIVTSFPDHSPAPQRTKPSDDNDPPMMFPLAPPQNTLFICSSTAGKTLRIAKSSVCCLFCQTLGTNRSQSRCWTVCICVRCVWCLCVKDRVRQTSLPALPSFASANGSMMPVSDHCNYTFKFLLHCQMLPSCSLSLFFSLFLSLSHPGIPVSILLQQLCPCSASENIS